VPGLFLCKRRFAAKKSTCPRQILASRVSRMKAARSSACQKASVFRLGMRSALSGVMHNTTALRFRNAALILLAAVGALSGCGDRGMFSRGEMREFSERSLGSMIDSRDVTVEHRSTRCGDNAAMACPKGMAPGVEIYVEPTSVIFDFSNVSEPGVFADTDFEGFVVEIAAEAKRPIMFAHVDARATTLAFDAGQLTHDKAHLELNFAGASYDSDSFVKIDLLFGPLNLLGRGE